MSGKTAPTINGNANGAPDWSSATAAWSFSDSTGDLNSLGVTSTVLSTSTTSMLNAASVYLFGGDLKTEPWAGMNKFASDNRKAIKEAGVEASTQYGSWAIAFDLTTMKNAATATWEKGWGYFPVPGMTWTDGTDCAAVPVNWGA